MSSGFCPPLAATTSWNLIGRFLASTTVVLQGNLGAIWVSPSCKLWSTLQKLNAAQGIAISADARVDGNDGRGDSGLGSHHSGPGERPHDTVVCGATCHGGHAASSNGAGDPGTGDGSSRAHPQPVLSCFITQSMSSRPGRAHARSGLPYRQRPPVFLQMYCGLQWGHVAFDRGALHSL